MQAHADALGSWGDNGAASRRAWEGDGRIDLRSVTNCLRQLPYHVAWQKGFRQAAGVLNPTVPIDTALETCRELGEGIPLCHRNIYCKEALPAMTGVLVFGEGRQKVLFRLLPCNMNWNTDFQLCAKITVAMLLQVPSLGLPRLHDL